jgi:hypothetical protein
MNLDVLQNEYKNDPRCFQIADRITTSKPQRLHLKGIAGSVSQFIISAVFNHSSCSQLNHLVILRDAEEAAEEQANADRRGGTTNEEYYEDENDLTAKTRQRAFVTMPITTMVNKRKDFLDFMYEPHLKCKMDGIGCEKFRDLRYNK